MKTWIKKHRIVAFVLGVFLALSSGALAAFIIYDLTVGGSATGNLTITTTHLDALTISNNGPAPTLDSNQTNVPVSVNVTNNDSVQHFFNTPPTVSIASSNPSCTQYLSASLNGSQTPWNAAAIAGGASMTGTVNVTTGNAPLSCSGSTFTITLSGTGIVS